MLPQAQGAPACAGTSISMTRLKLALTKVGVLTLALLASSSVGGQGLIYFDGRPTYNVITSVEKLTSYPAKLVEPAPKAPDATQIALPYQPPFRSRHIINDNYGGQIMMYQAQYQTLSLRGDEFEIRGSCDSACTLVMQIPRERICFGPDARLRFHMAREYQDGPPSLKWAQYMIDKYPTNLQDWINAKGGAAALPLIGYWSLPAAELWKMGYRRCN